MKKIAFIFSILVLIKFTTQGNGERVSEGRLLSKQKDSTELFGCWSFIEVKDGFHWEKTTIIKEGNIGYEFKPDGTMIKRHPKNWYEDPAVTFEDYKGTWKMLSPDMIEMFYDFPDGRRVRESVFINIFKDGKMVWQRLGWEEVGK
jgi:hypothetical protein